MGNTVKIDQLATEIMKGLTEYSDMATDDMKAAVKKAGISVKKDIQSTAPTDRPMTTPLFLLRCVQLGISIRDLDLLTIGMVNDMYAESGNDEYKGYSQMATQEDFDKF